MQAGSCNGSCVLRTYVRASSLWLFPRTFEPSRVQEQLYALAPPSIPFFTVKKKKKYYVSCACLFDGVSVRYAAIHIFILHLRLCVVRIHRIFVSNSHKNQGFQRHYALRNHRFFSLSLSASFFFRKQRAKKVKQDLNLPRARACQYLVNQAAAAASTYSLRRRIEKRREERCLHLTS